MNAVIYARVSSTDESQSYERQLADLKRFAAFKNLNVTSTFAEKISGYKSSLDSRIEFNLMLEYIDKHNIKNILVSELSRISRRYIDTINFIDDCSKKGINIHILKEGLSTLNENGTENSVVQMLVGMLSSMAQQESQSLSYRIKSGKRYKATQGLGLRIPFGYFKNEQGKPEIHKENSRIVTKIFELALEGFGAERIKNYLNSSIDYNSPKVWTQSSVQGVLKNKFYTGIAKHNEMRLKVPQIVSTDVFDKALEFRKSRIRFTSRNKVATNPFASFIRCQCGATMYQVVQEKRKADLYRCADRCGVKSVNRPFLINEVRTVMERNAKMSKTKEARERLENNSTILQADLKEQEKALFKLKKMLTKNYEAFLEEKVDESTYNQFKASYELQIQKRTHSIENISKSLKEALNALKSDLNHYSEDLEIFKQQLLLDLEYIEIKHEIAVVKIKAWGKQVIILYRGGKLKVYNRLNGI